MIRVAPYIRQSLNDKSSSSPERQLDVINSWCKSRDLIPGPVYRDLGGKRSEDQNAQTRPRFQAMMADAASKKFDIIVVSAQDRFGTPDIYSLFGYLSSLRDYGVELWDAGGNVLLNPSGREATGILRATVGSIIDTGEQASRSRNVLTGMISQARRVGAFMGGRIPFGLALRCVTGSGVELWRCEVTGKYKNDRDNWSDQYLKITATEEKIVARIPSGDRDPGDTIVWCPSQYPDRLEAVRIMFNQAANGVGSHSIVGILNTSGYRTQYGTLFYQRFIEQLLLMGHALTGKPAFGRLASGKYHQASKDQAIVVDNLEGKQHYKDRDSWLISDVQLFEPIISPMLWEQVQQILDKKKLAGRKGRSPTRPTAIYTGLLICDHCGKIMSSHWTRGSQTYSCTTYITKGGVSSGCNLNTVNQKALETLTDSYLAMTDQILSWVEENDPLVALYDQRAIVLDSYCVLKKAMEHYLWVNLADIFHYTVDGEYRIFDISGYPGDVTTIRLPDYDGSPNMLQELVDWIESAKSTSTRTQYQDLVARRDQLARLFPESTNRSVRDNIVTQIDAVEAEMRNLGAGGTSFGTRYRALLRDLVSFWSRAKVARSHSVPMTRRGGLLQVLSKMVCSFEKTGRCSRLVSVEYYPLLGESVILSCASEETGKPIQLRATQLVAPSTGIVA